MVRCASRDGDEEGGKRRITRDAVAIKPDITARVDVRAEQMVRARTRRASATCHDVATAARYRHA